LPWYLPLEALLRLGISLMDTANRMRTWRRTRCANSIRRRNPGRFAWILVGIPRASWN